MRIKVNAPNKIEIFPEFVGAAEEQEILAHLKAADWQQIQMQGQIAKRKVLHFGMDYNYERRTASPTQIPMPEYIQGLLPKVAEILNVTTKDVAQILVTQYPPGAGIGWHKDAKTFGDAIAGVSLLSSCKINFRLRVAEDFEVFETELPPRSAYVFSQDARYIWEHSITSHKEERYSLTFRTLAPASVYRKRQGV